MQNKVVVTKTLPKISIDDKRKYFYTCSSMLGISFPIYISDFLKGFRFSYFGTSIARLLIF